MDKTGGSSNVFKTYNLGPIPYDDNPGDGKGFYWSASTTRMARGADDAKRSHSIDIGSQIYNSKSESSAVLKCTPYSSHKLAHENKANSRLMDEIGANASVAADPDRIRTDSTGDVGTGKAEDENSKGNQKKKPPGTLWHEVKSGETLDSIALLYDTMPSFLMKLNKKTSRFIFPGQELIVPDKDNLDLLSKHQSSCGASGTAARSSGFRTTRSSSLMIEPLAAIIPTQDFSKPSMDLTQKNGSRSNVSGSLEDENNKENSKSPVASTVTGLFSGDAFSSFRKKRNSGNEPTIKRPRALTRAESIRINEACAEKFLKIDVLQMLHNQAVKGTLLITPNAVMFESEEKLNETDSKVTSESSSLSLDHELIIPMSLISSAAVISDIPEVESRGAEKPSSPNKTSSVELEKSDSVSNGESLGSKDPNETPSSPKSVPQPQSTLAKFFGVRDEDLTGSWQLFNAMQSLFLADNDSSDSSDLLRELSLYLRICLRDAAFESLSANHKSSTEVVRGSLREKYWFKIPVEWVDRVYAFFVEWIPEEGLVSPKGEDKELSLEDKQDLNTFVLLDTSAVLNLEGVDTSMVGSEIDIQSDTDGPGFSRGGGASQRKESDFPEDWELSLKRSYTKEWEILHSDEYEKRQVRQLERSLPIPDLYGVSHIMSSQHVKKLLPHLPSRCMGAVWVCLYNSQLDGLSINTLYRKCDSPVDPDTCCLLIINPKCPPEHDLDQSLKNDQSERESEKEIITPGVSKPRMFPNHAFGAILSNPPRMSRGIFYGSGQSSVFKFSRRDRLNSASHMSSGGISSSGIGTSSLSNIKLHNFQWSGTNSLFCSCGCDYITVGGDNFQAKPALTIDGDLLRGQTYECETFNSPKLTPDGQSHFEISSLEVWAFIPENTLDVMDIRIQSLKSLSSSTMQVSL